MKRFVKWTGILVVALVALLVIAVGSIIVFVDPNDYRDEIAGVVERQTGREFAIDGDLELTFFPWFGLAANGVRLADAEGFGQQPFVRIERLRLAVRVLPLLRGELALDTIILERPQIHLVRNQAGTGNWETLGAPETPPESTTDTGPAPSGGDAGLPPMLRNATLAGFIINDARVVWEDRQDGATVTVDPFHLELENVRAGAEIPLQADWTVTRADGPELAGTLSATAMPATDLSTVTLTDIDLEITVSGETVPAGEQSLQLTGRVSANLDDQVYQASELALQIAGITVEATALARTTGSGISVEGNLTVPEFSPRELMEHLGMEPPETRDPAVLQTAGLEAEFHYGANGMLTVDPLQASLDDTALTGTATVRDFSGPSARFDLTMDRIDVDRYLAPEDEQQAPSGQPQGEGPSDDTGGGDQLPLEPLRTLTLDGRFRIGELGLAGARMTEADLTVTAADGRIRIHPLTADLYGGRYQGDVRLDATGDRLVVSLNEKLTGIQAQPLLSDVAAFDKLLGSGNLSIDATMQGAGAQDFLRSLAGEASFLFQDGMVKGINIAQTLRAGLARLQGESPPDSDEPLQTDYGKLGGTLHFDGGTVRNEDLHAETPLLRIDGSGKANLLERTLDYNLVVNVVGTLEGQGGADLAALRNVPIPLHFGGKLTDPKIRLDMASAAEAIAGERIAEEKAELEQKLDEKKEKVKQKVEEKLGEKLKGLFDR